MIDYGAKKGQLGVTLGTLMQLPQPTSTFLSWPRSRILPNEEALGWDVEHARAQWLNQWRLYCSTAKICKVVLAVFKHYCIRFFMIFPGCQFSHLTRLEQWHWGSPAGSWHSSWLAAFSLTVRKPRGPRGCWRPFTASMEFLKLLAICSILCMFGISTCFRCGHSSKTVQKTGIDVLPSVQNLVS